MNIKQKSSSVAGKAPQPADLERGELAVNLADKKLFTKDHTDAIVELGGGASTIPGLSDTTVQAPPYVEPADASGYLTRMGGVTTGDPDEYQVTRVNLAVSDTPPANPHLGMVWQDTSGAPVQFWWNGMRWVQAGDPWPAPGTFFADFTIEQGTNTDPVTVEVYATGHDDTKSFIQWSDGQKTTGINGAKSHTYAEVGTYTIRITVAGAAAVLDGGDRWPRIYGPSTTLRKVGPVSKGCKIKRYPFHYWRDPIEWNRPSLAEIDKINEINFENADDPALLSDCQYLFKGLTELKPEKVKGVKPQFMEKVDSMFASRIDIKELPWKEFSEAISMNSFAEGSGIKEAEGLSFPKATAAIGAFKQTKLSIVSGSFPLLSNAQEMFLEAKIDELALLSMPSLTSAVRMFHKCTIGSCTASIDNAGPVACDYRDALYNAVITNMKVGTPIFKTVENASTVGSMSSFTRANVLENVAWSVRTDETIVTEQMLRIWRINVIHDIFDYNGGNVSAVHTVEWKYKGSCGWQAGKPGLHPNCVNALFAGAFDQLTDMTPGASPYSFFNGAKLNQQSVNAIIKEFHKAFVTDAKPLLGPNAAFTLDVAGGSNAAPTATAEITALAGAGITVVHN